MPDRPVTERENPASARLDELPTRELVKLMNAEDARVPAAVAAELDAIARAIDTIAAKLTAGGRLLYLGAGTSGRLGVLDASECPPTFGTDPELVVGLIAGGEAALVRAQEGAEDRRELALADLATVGLSSRDVVVGISASGATPYVLAGIEHAKAVGALTIGLSCNPGSPLSKAAALAITPVAGPEVVTGSTRLKAGTATKLVLNMLSTGVMVRLGRVRGNLMVDLKPGSAKLGQRAAGIVAQLAGIDTERASALLSQNGNSVRAALAAADATRPPPKAAPEREPGTALVVGIDGGGSKTEAWLAEAKGAVLDLPLGAATVGACNLTSDLDGAAVAIELAIAHCFKNAARRKAPIDALVVAAAGAGNPALRGRLRAGLLERKIAQRVAIVHDAAPLLAGLGGDGSGVVLIAGTGSFCFGRNSAGRCARNGGLGGFVGDEGSAFALGRAALVAAARAADGRGVALKLVKSIYETLGTSDARKLSAWAASVAQEPAKVAALAPLVAAAAEKRDPVATRILERAAGELALLVKTVVLKLGLPREPLPLLLAGGVFDACDRQRGHVVAALRSLGVTADVQPATSAAAGAVALARELLAGRLDEASWFPA